MEHLLKNRDYTLIVARSASQDAPKIPALEQAWIDAQSAIIALAKKCEAFDPDGLTIYTASTPFAKYEQTTSEMLVDVFENYNPTETIDLANVLQAALDDYFTRKVTKQTKENGEIVIVVLDREPSDRSAIIRQLVDATQKMDCQEELGIGFAQVGEDPMTRGFLKSIDDDLHAAGAKFNIADTQFSHKIQERSLQDFLLGALYD